MTAPVTPGDVLLGKYRVERILGQGGMGIVVAARHIELGEPFAIKFLLPHLADHPQAVDRFVREARASAKLKGEHIAKVHDVGRLPDGLPYMVLEYLAGKDLKQALRERGPLPVAEAVAYLLQVCEAIAEAHAHGIVHRDIKPANLFLTRRVNGTPCVKVLDFGISSQIEPEDPEQHSLTTTGMLLGSPRYMSPEQMIRTKEADARSDIWSLGCVLYELLTGRVSFSGDTLTELVGKVLQEEPPLPSAHRGDIPPAVERVVMHCLVKRKEERFQTVEQLAEALRSAMVQPAPVPVPPVLAPVVPIRASSPSYHEATLPFPDVSPPVAAHPGPAPIANTTAGWGTTSPEANVSPRRRSVLASSWGWSWGSWPFWVAHGWRSGIRSRRRTKRRPPPPTAHPTAAPAATPAYAPPSGPDGEREEARMDVLNGFKRLMALASGTLSGRPDRHQSQ